MSEPIRFDVSEMKTLNECGRKWQLTSRNAYHLRPRVMNTNLFFGSLFHECLATMYLGGKIERIVEQAERECSGDPALQRTIKAMLEGYYSGVLPADLERFKVIDVEHRFSLPMCVDGHTDGELVGSIDMLALERGTNVLWGFEHKTAAKFRPDAYLMMDEQPRVYFLALQEYVARHNIEHPENLWRLGGIYINEIKKVQRSFEYNRRACVYSPAQLEGFAIQLVHTLLKLEQLKVYGAPVHVTPSYMQCQMCDMAAICQTYAYEDAPLEMILEEFGEEYAVREVDHLEEKAERSIEG